MTEYTEEEHQVGEDHPILGAEYQATRNAVDGFLKHWTEEHVARISEEAIKPLVDQLKREVSEALEDYLLADVECNAAGTMCRMVECSVRALIGGRN